jgi:hypothetical protein
MAEESARAYALRRVKDAIRQAGGDRNVANRMLLQACARDSRLLGGLTGPFLKGIIAHAMQNAAGADAGAGVGAAAGANHAKPPRKPKALTTEGLDAVIGSLGDRIGTAPSQSRGASILTGPKPTKAGDAHRQSIRALARAFAQKRFDP